MSPLRGYYLILLAISTNIRVNWTNKVKQWSTMKYLKINICLESIKFLISGPAQTALNILHKITILEYRNISLGTNVDG